MRKPTKNKSKKVNIKIEKYEIKKWDEKFVIWIKLMKIGY